MQQWIAMAWNIAAFKLWRFVLIITNELLSASFWGSCQNTVLPKKLCSPLHTRMHWFVWMMIRQRISWYQTWYGLISTAMEVSNATEISKLIARESVGNDGNRGNKDFEHFHLWFLGVMEIRVRLLVYIWIKTVGILYFLWLLNKPCPPDNSRFYIDSRYFYITIFLEYVTLEKIITFTNVIIHFVILFNIDYNNIDFI